MRDLSYLVALSGIVFLLVAAVAWWRIFLNPAEKPPTERDAKRAGSAAMYIVIAFLLSVVAAGLALFRWF